MINLQVTFSELSCRKRQFKLEEQQVLILRFGSIKLQITVIENGQGLIGGKKVVLDLSAQQLQNMFQDYAFGVFMQNSSGKFFSILSLQKMSFQDIVSGQEVYFYNDQQEVIYSANLSLIITAFKKPKLPNKQRIQSHKSFEQIFKKPAVPTRTECAKTLSSFLYGTGNSNRQKQNQKNKKPVRNPKPQNIMAKTQNPYSSSKQGWAKKTKQSSGFLQTQKIPLNVNYGYDESQDTEDSNPPMMQFTNTTVGAVKGVDLLKTQLAQLTTTAPQVIKLQLAYENRNAFQKTKSKPPQALVNKVRSNLAHQWEDTHEQTNRQQNPNIPKVNRQDLKNKAKSQLQSYQGNNNIKIPIFKQGKYQYVDLAHLGEDQILQYARKQKQLQQQERDKKAMQKRLRDQERYNQMFRVELQEKQKRLARQQEQARRQRLQLLNAQKVVLQKQKALSNKNLPQNLGGSYQEQSSQDVDQNQENSEKSQQQQQDKQDDQDYYQSDFEEMSMASEQKKQRVSITPKKKQQQSQSYGDSYDPDFENYSQSFLGSLNKLSSSEISESLRNTSPYNK